MDSRFTLEKGSLADSFIASLIYEEHIFVIK
jgi:hypothetical protein